MVQVSIGLPVYNGEKYLAEVLDSLLTQSLRDFEIIISDNASTDRTAELCQAYQRKDSRIRYFRNKCNIGASPNFNRTFELSSASLFQCAAYDDMYEPFFLERCVDALDRDSGVVLSHTDTRMVGDNGEPLHYDRAQNRFVDSYGDFVMGPEAIHIGGATEPERRFREVLWLSTWCLPLFGVIRREALLKTGLHRSYYGADKVLLAELAVQGRFHQIDEKLFVKRVHRGCTYYKSVHQKAEYDSTAPQRGIAQLKMLRDYAKIAFAVDFTLAQRIHCTLTLAGMARRHGLWRRFLIPGPDNYLGLSFGGK